MEENIKVSESGKIAIFHNLTFLKQLDKFPYDLSF